MKYSEHVNRLSNAYAAEAAVHELDTRGPCLDPTKHLKHCHVCYALLAFHFDERLHNTFKHFTHSLGRSKR